MPGADQSSAIRRVVILSAWRREVADVTRTLRDAAAWQRRSVRFRGSRRRIPQPVRVRPGDVVLASDRRAIPAGAAGAPVLRLWWNAADEVLEHATPADETPIVFFPDVASHLTTLPRLLFVPYAFSTPTPPSPTLVDRIAYSGEVDVTDTCLEGPGRSPARVKELSDRLWDVSRAIVRGDARLCDVEMPLRSLVSDDPADPALAPSLLWAARNRVRYLLMQAVAAAFPDRMALRGTDWQKAGFTAEPTSFNRRVRMESYRTSRVSLDLGSKSTFSPLYPRSADVMAAGGSLVQFSSGAPADEWTSMMSPRQALSADALVAGVDRLLSLPQADLVAENADLQRAYERARLRAGTVVLDAMAAAVADQPTPR